MPNVCVLRVPTLVEEPISPQSREGHKESQVSLDATNIEESLRDLCVLCAAPSRQDTGTVRTRERAVFLVVQDSLCSGIVCRPLELGMLRNVAYCVVRPIKFSGMLGRFRPSNLGMLRNVAWLVLVCWSIA